MRCAAPSPCAVALLCLRELASPHSIEHNQLDANIKAELAEVINGNVPLDDDDSVEEGYPVSEEVDL